MSYLNLHWFFPILRGMGLGLLAMAVHEAAHVVAALALGIEVKKIGMGWKGMYTVRHQSTPGKNMLVSLAGPLTNRALLVFWHWLPLFGLANLCIGAVNLLPIEGSDGLRVMNCWQQMHKKDVPVL
jgi:Zn-dependent protease